MKLPYIAHKILDNHDDILRYVGILRFDKFLRFSFNEQ